MQLAIVNCNTDPWPTAALADIGHRAARPGTVIRATFPERGCRVIVPGCAGMAPLPEQMASSLPVPVVDVLTVPVSLCEDLVHLGAFQPPDPVHVAAFAWPAGQR